MDGQHPSIGIALADSQVLSTNHCAAALGATHDGLQYQRAVATGRSGRQQLAWWLGWVDTHIVGQRRTAQ